MYVFSDLDRTVIYSNKFLDTEVKYSNIEKHEDREISYVSLDTIEYIKEIQDIGMFIPTTTRTTEQFKRINFDKYGISFPWAITTNGGCILNNNEVLESWSNEVENIKNKSCDLNIMVNDFEKYTKLPGVIKFAVASELFFYIVADYSIFNISCLQEYVDILDERNWDMYISGRKIYFLPKGITKENAIKYLIKELNIKEFTAIGDSTMDYGMVKSADHGYVLKHGDMLSKNTNNNLFVSNLKGMDGSEEILGYIIESNKVQNVL
jgi:hydroxymethylpyrimidine pyrophosphatase-like HAD family hydrolase